jgi:opacity protein-like surface antigen
MASMPIVTVNQGGTSTIGVVGAGYKYYLSDDMALRAMLGFSTSSDGDEAKTGGKTTNTNYGIAVGVEMHTHAVYSTSPYFGAQLGFGGASYDNKTTQGSVTSETKNSGTTFGIGVLAGFDWYFTHGLAVGAEYMLGFQSMSASKTTTDATGTSTTTDLPSSSSIGISNAGNVHLVVHF